MELTSLDYSRLIGWLAYYKHNTILNKTQMQKILFACYGVYLATTGERLFKDDTPKAWPYGPVFPRVNRRYNPNSTTFELSENDKAEFLKNKQALNIVSDITDKFYNKSAHQLTEWSHLPGSPWFITLYGINGDNKEILWNKVIEDDIIAKYFKK